MKKRLWLLLVIIGVFSITLLFTSCKEPVDDPNVTHEVWVYDGTESDFFDVVDGEVFDYTPVNKPDFVFEGLYLDKDYQKKYDETSKVKTDLELYVHYVKSKMTVTFDANGGIATTTKKVKYNEAVQTPASKPCKLYGEFVCWCLDKEGKNPFDFSTLITEDLTLYAYYKEVSYDGLIDEYIPDVINQDVNYSLPDSGVNFIFESSDPTCFSNVGMYLPARTDKEITVTLTINAGVGSSVSYSKKATVKGYSLPELETGKVVAGYSSSWYLGEYVNGYSKEILNTCNIINICFAYVKMTGELDMSGLSSFPRYITECHKNGIRVCLSIQGSENSSTKEFAACAANATLRKTLADNIAKVVKEYNLDGVDIDWEYPHGEEIKNYTFLMEEIRKSLDNLGEDFLLTAAIPGGSWGAGVVEMEKVAKIFDFVNMMSYDLEGTDTGSHHTALYKSTYNSGTRPGASIEEAVELWHTTYKVPYSKICLGMAFYGKPAMCNTQGNSKILGNVKTQSLKNVRYSVILEEKFKNFGAETNKFYYDYDESAEAPYIYSVYSQTAKTNYFLTYDNERSLIAKCEYAKKVGLGGVMIWELGEDNTNNLISAVAQGMGNHIDGKAYVVTGKQEFNVGNVIEIKTVEEIMQSVNKDVIYKISDGSIASINGTTVTFNKAGNIKITACSSDEKTIYGVMEIVVK